MSAPEGLWKDFCSAVDHFSGEAEKRDKLILLLVCVSNVDLLDDNGCSIASSMNRDKFWQQLPGYSLEFRDEMTCGLSKLNTT